MRELENLRNNAESGITNVVVFAVTERNEADPKKFNEDWFLSNVDKGVFFVLDGVSRSLNKDGSYPTDISTIAVPRVIRSLRKFFEGLDMPNDSEQLQIAMQIANREVGKVNAEICLDKNTINWEDGEDLLGIVGVAASFDRQKEILHLAYIGDCFAILLNKDGYKVLTEDQTINLRRFQKTQEWDRGEMFRQIRGVIRNNKSYFDKEGNLVGYGVLTGEDEAMGFVNLISTPVKRGDVLILASDGIGFMGGETIFDIYSSTDINKLSSKLVKVAKEKESRSDDKTAIIVRFL